jgi:hypothetical protein
MPKLCSNIFQLTDEGIPIQVGQGVESDHLARVAHDMIMAASLVFLHAHGVGWFESLVR